MRDSCTCCLFVGFDDSCKEYGSKEVPETETKQLSIVPHYRQECVLQNIRYSRLHSCENNSLLRIFWDPGYSSVKLERQVPFV